MIKSLTIALAMIPNNNRVKMGSHAVMKPDSDSNEQPGINDKEYDSGKRQWMQATLYQLQSARIDFLHKEEIAKEILELLDLDEVMRIGSNIMAAGLTGDWDFDIHS